MDQKIYHGDITPDQIAQNLVAHFNRNNLRAQQLGSGEHVCVQIATNEGYHSGGDTAISIDLQKAGDGVSIQIGKQAWLGVAADLGMTALTALRNPFALIGRLGSIAQDIESLQLSEEIWQVIDAVARSAHASHEISERLRRMVCDYCNTANPVGEPRCIACGAPLGDVQPFTCPNCGFVLTKAEQTCPNCGRPLAG